MHITSIEKLAQKKNRVFIDDEYAFMLYDRDIAIYSLREGQELSDLLYHTIIKDTVFRRAKQRAVAILERSDRTEAEIRKKLREDMYSEEITDSVIEYLTGLHYIDDRRYAENYIRGRAALSSVRELTGKLLQKGVSKDIISDAIASVEEERTFGSYGDEGSGMTLEQSAAVAVLSKKLGGRTVIDCSKRQKLIAFMLRKGYRMSDISTAFEALNIEFEASDETNSKINFLDLSDNF